MSHLTLANRCEIENGLRHGESFQAIANRLHCSRTTVTREVRKHAQPSDKGAKGRVTNRCIYRNTCTKHFACSFCTRPLQNRRCSSCSQCNKICHDFEELRCTHLEKPPYVCNGCTREGICVLRKKFYIASVAQKEYETLLVKSRQGIIVSDEERIQMMDFLSAGMKKGQSLHHVCQANPDSFTYCERSLYNYVNKGLFAPAIGRLDLPVAVARKPRRKRGTAHRVDPEYRKGRTNEDYKAFMATHPDLDVVEMDSVEGTKGGKVLLTLNFNCSTLMLCFIRDANTSQSVIDVFNTLEEIWGLETFRKLFPVILTDNGSEFTNPSALETSINGKDRRTNIFFCDPMASWQKPHVENNHQNLRAIFPKGVSMDHVTPEKVTLAMSHLNSKLRHGLNDIPAIKLFSNIYGEEVLKKLGVQLIPANEVNLTPDLVK